MLLVGWAWFRQVVLTLHLMVLCYLREMLGSSQSHPNSAGVLEFSIFRAHLGPGC